MKRNTSIIFEDAYFDEKEYVYFFAYDINGLFRMDINTDEIVHLVSVSEYNLNKKRMYGAVTAVNDFLIFSPLSADDILIYDIKSGKYELISLYVSQNYNHRDTKFGAICSLNERVYLFPAFYPAIVEVDLRNFSLNYYDKWLKDNEEMMSRGVDFFRHSTSVFRNHILIPFCYKNTVIDFDTETKEINEIHLFEQDVDIGFSGICFDGVYHWLSPLSDGCVYKWNYETGETIRIPLHNNIENGFTYVGCFCLRDRVVVIPSLGNNLGIIDSHTYEIVEKTVNDCGLVEQKKDGFSSSFFILTQLDEKRMLVCCPHRKKTLVIMKLAQNVLFTPCNEDFSTAIEEWNHACGCKKDLFLYENGFNLLNDLIETLNF